MDLPVNSVQKSHDGLFWGEPSNGMFRRLDHTLFFAASDAGPLESLRAATTLVIIDPSVDHYETLIDGIEETAIVQVLSPEQDGIHAITQTLEHIGTIQTLHLVSHGAPGYLRLGSSALSLDTLTHDAARLQRWFGDRTPHPAIVVYGCNVAAGDAGEEFIRKLHQLTGASVSASVNPIGHPDLGGSWHLECRLGPAAQQSIFSEAVQQAYRGTFPEPVTTLITTTQAATPSTITINGSGAVGSSLDENTQYTVNFGQGDNLLLSGFEVNGETFGVAADTTLTIRRNPVNTVINTPFFDVIDETGTTFNVAGDQITTDEEALDGNIINRGIEAVFLNDGRGVANIERLDYVSATALPVTGDPADTGFLVVERGANDSFNIAAITAVDAAGNPTAYGDLITVQAGDFGTTGQTISPLQLRTEQPGPVTADNVFAPNQSIGAVYVSLEDLGLTTGQNFLGYSLFAPDVNPTDNLVDWLSFPTDTDAIPGNSLDPLAGGLVFTANPVTPIDLDADDDGILDTIEDNGNPNRDTDGDGIVDRLDIDADGDGILDIIEAGHGQPGNANGILDGPFGVNGFADILEAGVDSGIPNFTILDSDNDGIPDFQDLDSDNDGIPDNVEAQPTVGYRPPTNLDGDGDGLDNAYDPDNGGAFLDPVNTDGTDQVDYLDLNSDNDALPDASENGDPDNQIVGIDSDGDGIDDAFDDVPGPDVNDNIDNPATDLPNTNGTGDVDYRDVDTVTPPPTPSDKDGDGVLNDLDLDEDNDGIPDSVELAGDPNRDTDGDGIKDSCDLDSDNDGILDVVEAGHGQLDSDGDGRIDGGPSVFGANGFANALETAAESGIANFVVADTDGDGIPDFQDLDADNDGILDVTEGTVDNSADPDRNGLVGSGVPVVNVDGIANVINAAVGGTPYDVTDTDGDGTPDFRDLDTDNDGINDLIERGGNPARLDADTDGDGRIDAADSDGDGIVDVIDNNTGFGPAPASNPFPQDDRPQTDIPNYRELPLGIVKPTGNTLSGLSDADEIPVDPTVPNGPINGGSDADILVGGADDDVINGGTGDDIIRGRGGNDVLNGGTGNDTIGGGRGNDVINGGAGNDTIRGGRQNDTIRGSAGNDRLMGNAGQDDIAGGRGNDRIVGGLGNDTLAGGEGRDRFIYRSDDDFGDTNTDFEIIKDIIVLNQVGSIGSLNDLSFQQQGNNVLIQTSGGATIVLLENVNADSLSDRNFSV